MRGLPSTVWLPALSAPVFLVGTAVVLGGYGTLPAVALLGVAAAALPLLAPFVGRWGGMLWIAPGAALAVGGLFALVQNLSPTGTGLELQGGVIGASLLLPLALVLRFGRDAGVHLLAVTAGLVDLVTLVAAPSMGSAVGIGSLPGLVAQVHGSQWNGLQQLLTGAKGAGLPLQTLPAPTLLALALLALAGAVLAFYAPTAGLEDDAEGPESAVSLLGPLGVGVVAAGGFEALAATQPAYALFVLACGVYAVLILLLLWSRREPARTSRPARGPARAGVAPRPAPTRSGPAPPRAGA